jgi:CheY-like chemotaxis protein
VSRATAVAAQTTKTAGSGFRHDVPTPDPDPEAWNRADRSFRLGCAWFLHPQGCVWPNNAADHRTYLKSHPLQEHHRMSRRLLALLVSSDPDLQDAVLETLRAHGHSVVCAADLDKARSVVQQASPHVLFADLDPAALAGLLPHLAPSTAVIEVDGETRPDVIVTALQRAQEAAHSQPHGQTR